MAHRKMKAFRKDVTVRMRVTAEQRRLMAEAAQLTGLDLSAWLRTLAVQEARKRTAAGGSLTSRA